MTKAHPLRYTEPPPPPPPPPHPPSASAYTYVPHASLSYPTTADDEAEQNNDYLSPQTTTSKPPFDGPRSRPRLPSPPRSQLENKKASHPKPPPKPIQLQDQPEDEYIVPQVIVNEDNYHILSPTRPEDAGEDTPQPYYEDLDFGENDDAFRQNPPPPKKSHPPPLPTRPRPRHWTRSFGSSDEEPVSSVPTGRGQQPGPESGKMRKGNQRMSHEPNAPRTNLKPPAHKHHPQRQPMDYETSVSAKQQMTPPLTRKMDYDGSSKMPSGGKQGPPPVKPKPSIFQGGVGFNLKNDPKFSQKLQERREEIYGGTDRVRFTSDSDEPDPPLDEYEEVLFTASAEEQAVPKLVENDEGYIDVQMPDQPDDYYTERSPSPLFSTGPLLPPRQKHDTKHSSNPSLHQQHVEVPAPASKNRPALRPPIGTERPGFSDRSCSVSPEPVSTFPAKETRRISLPNSPTSPIHPIPISRSFRKSPASPPAPPLPSRELILPHPAPRRERPPHPTLEENAPSGRGRPPMPLPQQDNMRREVPEREPPTVPSGRRRPPLPVPPVKQPPLPKRDKPLPPSLQEETRDSPPPIPRRHPQHSDRHRVASQQGIPRRSPAPEIENPFPLPPRAVSPIGDQLTIPQSSSSDSAPPVPDRALQPLKSHHLRPSSYSWRSDTEEPRLELVRSRSSPPPPSIVQRKPHPPPRPESGRPAVRNVDASSPVDSPPRHKPKPPPKPKPTLLPKPNVAPRPPPKGW